MKPGTILWKDAAPHFVWRWAERRYKNSAAGPDGLSARTRVSQDRAERFQVVIAAAVTPQGDPLAMARAELRAALATAP